MRQRIQFDVDGTTLRGDFYRPGGPGPHPAVVVVGPMTSVKEQVAGVYAVALAVRGIAALAIDHRHYGESGGEPRQYEVPDHKIADIGGAIDWLADSPEVEANRLGLVGVCLGSSYAAVARRLWESTGETMLVPAAAEGHGAPMHLPDIVDYYGTPRAGVANYRNEFAVMSREPWLSFDARAVASRVPVPTLFVHAEGALAPAWAQRFHDAMLVERRFEWLSPSSQVDFYDRPDRVDTAADLVCDHLLAHL